MKAFIAQANEDGMRLSRFVQRVTKGLPDAHLYRAFRNRRIKVNERRAAPEYRLAEGDCVHLYLNDEFFPDTKSAAVWRPAADAAKIAFDIVHEDANMAVLYKPAGVLCHPGEKPAPNLLDTFTGTLARRGEYDPAAEHTFAPALCNRLDYGTEGLLIAAKNASALRELNAVIRQGLLHKTYLCVCHGTPPEGEHHAFLLRDRAAKRVVVSGQQAQGSKPIITGVSVLEYHGAFSLCRVALLTGRTHQIRAHLAFLGAPLAGDAKYGGSPLPGLAHQALCAHELTFDASLPTEGILASLAGRHFTAQQAVLPRLWRQWKG